MKLYITVLCLLPSLLLGMTPKPMQLELCSTRNKTYNQSQKLQPLTTCVFCDPAVLATNYIIKEDEHVDVREMLNKNPYLSSFDQGHHLVIMPMSHKERSDHFSQRELAEQTNAVHDLSRKLYDGSYGQEYFTNWSKLAGQTVPHWHSQLKVYTQPPRSLPEVIELQNSVKIFNIEEAFSAIKSKLLLSKTVPVADGASFASHEKCLCCFIAGNHNEDEKKLIVARFKHNFVCLSHYPRLPGEVSVIPYRHVAAIRFLPKEEWRENMALAMALLSKMREYAHTHIRDCEGGNLYTKSLGSEVCPEEQMYYHVHTVVMPRTTVPFTPGFIDGNSSKLDYSPGHLFVYLKEFCGTFVEQSKKDL